MTTFDRDMAGICYQRVIFEWLWVWFLLFLVNLQRQKANLMRLVRHTSQTATSKKLKECMIQENQFYLTWFKVNYTLFIILYILTWILVFHTDVYNTINLMNSPKMTFVIENIASEIPSAILKICVQCYSNILSI